ncbi:unnamed protein product [Amaranthus hypochondriacus]
MSINYENPNYFLDQIPSFQPQDLQFQNPNEILNPIPNSDFFCFDPLLHLYGLDPLYIPPPLDFDPDNHNHDDGSLPNNPPSGSAYPTQTINFPQKQRVKAINPCFGSDLNFNGDLAIKEKVNSNYYNFNHNNCNNVDNYGLLDEGFGENSSIVRVNDKRTKAQSKAARVRRRKIKEKTNELGKIIPGVSKLNTAQMFEAASKYVKFMQTQLEILRSYKNLHQDDSEEEDKFSILSSTLIQEKLYANGKCLVPLELVPMLEQQCDSKIKPSISMHIKDLNT